MPFVSNYVIHNYKVYWRENWKI